MRLVCRDVRAVYDARRAVSDWGDKPVAPVGDDIDGLHKCSARILTFFEKTGYT